MNKEDQSTVRADVMTASLSLGALHTVISGGGLRRAGDCLFPAKTVAALLAVNPKTIFHWAKMGYLHPVKVGCRLRFTRQDVTRLLFISRRIWQAERRRLPAHLARTWAPTRAEDWR